MVNTDRDKLQLNEQLSAIQKYLAQINERLDKIETRLDQPSDLTEKISELEESFMLVADTYRYKTLQKYLAESNWFEADKETIELILQIMGKDREELSPEEIQHFPCNDLMVIDRLWRKYSGGRFGFSIQLAMYQEVGGSYDTTIEQNQKTVEDWGDRLGWRKGDRWLKCNELDYSLNAPLGCHPSRWWNSPYGSKMTNFFLGRLMKCNL